MKKRSVLVSFAALTVLLTAGAAQSLSGTNTVDSGDIIDRTIGTPDVKVGAFAGQTILDNSMTGNDVNEETLKFPTAESKDGDSICNADGITETCTTATITLKKPGKVYIMGTFGWETDPLTTNATYGTVKLVVDGTTVETTTVGEGGDDANLYPGPIQDLISLGAGSHEIKITFQENTGADDVDLNETHLVAWRVS